MSITRRDFFESAAALALVGAAAGSIAPPALAEDPTAEELMRPGPLKDEFLGKADAPVTLIEYASMTCTHCANFAVKVFPTLKSRYIDTGKVRYILREFPLDKSATVAFMLARCVGDDKYFAMVDVLFKMQEKWVLGRDPTPVLLGFARQAGLSESTFKACVANQKLLDDIEEVRQRAADKFGVSSTPTFFINGKMHRGEMTLDELTKELEPYLNR